MIVDNTKMVQLVMFLMAELSPKHSAAFLTLLLATTLENYNKEGSRRQLICALQYLSSYIARSLTLDEKKTRKVVNVLILQLKSRIFSKESIHFDNLNILEFADKNMAHLHFFNTILVIFANQPLLKESLAKEFEEIIDLAHEKLHFTIFID